MNRGCWLAAALMGLAGAVLADEPQPGFGRTLPDEALAAERGGAAAQDDTQVWNTINLDGQADHISVSHAITGDNSVGGASFSGSRGFPTVIQNSGNGVLIQNATIINVTVKP